MGRNIDEFLKVVDTMLPVWTKFFGFKFNYTPQTLKKLEPALVNMFPHKKLANETVAVMGAYLGETIVRNVKGAEWVDFDEAVMDAYIVVKTKNLENGEMKLNPFIRIEKFMKDHTDGLYPFYAMVQDVYNGRIRMDGAVKKGVLEGRSPRGYDFKVTSVSPDVHKLYQEGKITKAEMMKMAQEGQA